MMKTQDDKDFIPFLEEDLNKLSKSFSSFTSYVANCNKKTEIKTNEFFDLSQEVLESLDKINFINELKNKFVNFISESRQLIELANNGNREEVKKFINNCSLLFKRLYGIKHMDFVAYKDD